MANPTHNKLFHQSKNRPLNGINGGSVSAAARNTTARKPPPPPPPPAPFNNAAQPPPQPNGIPGPGPMHVKPSYPRAIPYNDATLREQAKTMAELFCTVQRDEDFRDRITKTYKWPDMDDEAAQSLSEALLKARLEEMTEREKAITASYSPLTSVMLDLFGNLVDHAVQSRLGPLQRQIADQDAETKKLVKALDEEKEARSKDQARIDVLEQSFNSILRERAHGGQNASTSAAGSSSVASPTVPPSAADGKSGSPPASEMASEYKSLNNKYRPVGNEVRTLQTDAKAQIAKMAALEKDLKDKFDALGARFDKLEKELQVAKDPRIHRPGSTAPTVSAAADTAKQASELAALWTQLDSLSSEVRSSLGKRADPPLADVAGSTSHGGAPPRKIAKLSEDATPNGTAAAAASLTAGEADLLRERLFCVEARVGDHETRLGKAERDAQQQQQASLDVKEATKKGMSSSASDMDMSQDGNDQHGLDVLERRIKQLEDKGAPELALGPVKKEVDDLREQFDQRVPPLDAPEAPKAILALVQQAQADFSTLSAAVDGLSFAGQPVLDAFRSVLGKADDGPLLSGEQLQDRLSTLLTRCRDGLEQLSGRFDKVDERVDNHRDNLNKLKDGLLKLDEQMAAMGEFAEFMQEALPSMRDLYLLVSRAQQMGFIPQAKDLFPETDDAGGQSSAGGGAASRGTTPSSASTTLGGGSKSGTGPRPTNGLVHGGGSGGGPTASNRTSATPQPSANGLVAPPPAQVNAGATNGARPGGPPPGQP